MFFPFLSFWSPEYVIVFTYMGAKEQVRYNDAGTPSTSTQLRCSCKAVETLPSTTALSGPNYSILITYHLEVLR